MTLREAVALIVALAIGITVLKRSMSPGFAGIDNPLFYNEKTSMLFADAKDGLTRLIDAVQES